MKNVNQIRHQLELALAAYRNRFYHTSANYISKALALLPCERCNGSGRVSDMGGRAYTTDEPCPDCQKKPIDK